MLNPNLHYLDVNKYKVVLSTEEQHELLEKINKLKSTYITKALSLEIVREYLFNLWKTSLTSNSMHNTGRRMASSKLAEDYNSSQPGLSKKISARVNNCMLLAFTSNDEEEQIKAIQKAGLHPRIYFGDDFINLVKSNSSDAYVCYLQIQAHRKKLLYSILPMIARLAKERQANLSGEVLTYNDLLQEGLIAAYESTIAGYKLSKKTKWTSYVWEKVDKNISKYIADKSRTIHIPRNRLSRYRILQAIQNDASMHLTKHELLQIANHLALEKGYQMFSEEEIDKLISDIEVVNIPLQIIEDLNSNTLLPVEALYDTSNNLKRDIEYARMGPKIKTILKDLLSPREYAILLCRWDFDAGEVLGYENAAQRYQEKSGLSLSMEQIRSVESKAFERLRKCKDPRLLELWDASESLD